MARPSNALQQTVDPAAPLALGGWWSTYRMLLFPLRFLSTH